MSEQQSFTAMARRACAAEMEQILSHPFVVGMSAGTLPEQAFRRYMVQDYLFLIQYARVLALATAKAPDLAAMGRLAELLHATLNVEMELHRGFAERVGIGRRELEEAEMLPACHAYTSHLLAVAWSETPAVIAASLLPCQLGYAEIGQHLAARGEPSVPAYAEWVRAYSSDEYQSLATWLAGYGDALAAAASVQERERMLRVYRASTRCERAFWDMALGEEGDAG